MTEDQTQPELSPEPSPPLENSPEQPAVEVEPPFFPVEVVCDHIDKRLEEWIPAVAERVAAIVRADLLGATTAPGPTPYHGPIGDAAGATAPPEPEHASPEEAAELAELERVVSHRIASIDRCKDNAANDVEPGVTYWQEQVESLEKVLVADTENRDRCKARLPAVP